MRDYILFRKMVAPVLLQVLFWPAAFACIYFSIRLILDGQQVGWVPLIVGTLFVRVVFEIWLLLFRIYDKLSAIHTALQR